MHTMSNVLQTVAGVIVIILEVLLINDRFERLIFLKTTKTLLAPF